MAGKNALVQTNSSVSGSTIELLLDLVEIKLGCIEVYDRDDARELKALHKARKELSGLLGRPVLDETIPAMRAPRAARRTVAALHA